MIQTRWARPLALVVGLLSLTASGWGRRVEAPAIEQILINDNRGSAGTFENGVLTVHLEARQGEWHPDADSSPGIVVRAFGEVGRPLQVPGPQIRVIEGTEVRITIRNGIEKTLYLHGLNERGIPTAGRDTFSVAPGQTREVRFGAGNPGTYYYWASTLDKPGLGSRIAMDAELSGLLIVDPMNAPRHTERVFLISGWTVGVPVDTGRVLVERITMNGKSWPNTERLTYDIGDSVRLRVANVGAGAHPMHLHGFYYRVDSRGDAQVDTVFPPGSSPRWAVTERIPSGRTFSLTWVPTRAGNWLFHCHDPVHVRPNRTFDGRAQAAPMRAADEMTAMADMGGPILGITVREPAGAKAAAEPAARRQLRLVADIDSGGSPAFPLFGYSLGNDARPSLPGPTIVLKRGEPVAITVVNRLAEPTSVHWHGIELDSYYDGVPGFAGHPGHVAPQIAPGDSFVARFTPPRSGTFIYHPHVNEIRQQRAGLSGALIVVDDLAQWDSTHDLVMLVADPRRNSAADTVLLNGSPRPPARELRAGETYRFRFINIHTSRPGMIMKIMRDESVLSWRPVAKDGMPLPADLAEVRPAAQQMGNGETYDFEFTPNGEGRAAPGHHVRSRPPARVDADPRSLTLVGRSVHGRIGQ